MNRKVWIGVGIVVAVAALGGWWWKGRARQVDPKYRTAPITRGDITATVSATGSVEPVLQVQVGSQVSGTLARLNVDFNSRVRAGEVLCQLETSAFKARLAQAEAAVARAEAALKDARRQFSRTQELIKGDFISQADVDAAEVAVEQRVADLKQARASLESAQVDLDHTTIRSPIDGVVISRAVDVGQTVAASLQAPELFVIANDLKNMQVETKIDEADIGRIHSGLPVQFTVDAFPDVNFSGTVSQVRLQPLTESNVVTYTTVISTRNEDLKLRPGMTANVTVMVESRHDVLEVPNAALRFKPGGGGAGGNGTGRPGQGGAGGAGGGMRRSFGALVGRMLPNAYAQQAPPPQQDRPGANDPYVQKIRERVRSGELTREQAREMIRAYFEKQGIPVPARGAGGRPGGPSAEAGPAGSLPGAAPAERGVRPEGGLGAGAGAGARGDGAAAGAGPAASGKGAGVGTAREGGRGPWAGLRSVPGGYQPGAVWVLRDKKPARVGVLAGLTDGTMTEIRTEDLKEGDRVIVGLEVAQPTRSNLTPPPGMGGPQFRGPGGRR